MPGFAGMPTICRPQGFGRSLERCIDLAKGEQIVLMCAEGVPWRCHRSLLADALLVRGVAVSEITSGIRTQPHSLTSWADVEGVQITYPGEAGGHDLSPGSHARRR